MTDMLEQAARVLEAAAPTVADLFGGPLAGQGVSLIENVLGLHPTGDPSAAAQAVIGATPDQLIALNKAGLELKQKLADAGIALERDDDDDRASARSRQAQLKDVTPMLLALGITVGFFGLLVFLARHEVPAASRDLLNVMLGALGSAWTAIVAYYFGSSAGHAQATQLLAQVAVGQVPSRS